MAAAKATVSRSFGRREKCDREKGWWWRFNEEKKQRTKESYPLAIRPTGKNS